MTTIAAPTAVMHEIFSGIQGEGLFVGCRQIFVRSHGCHVACCYCDTPASHAAPPATCTVETAAGTREMAALPNPLAAPQVLAAVLRLQASYPHHSVSLTGGEPLLQRAWLDTLLPALHDAGLPSYLETNGLLSQALAALAVMPTYVAMDVKLPSTSGLSRWEDHAAFLAVALARLESPATRLQVKIVFGEESLADIAQAAAMLSSACAEIPCILQPVTPRPQGPGAPRPQTVLEAQRLAAAQLRDVRVIPQTHVMLGQW